MSHGIRFGRTPVLSSLAVALTLLALTGCTGNGGDASGVLGSVANTVRSNGLTIRVVNDTTAIVDVDIRVDGVMKTLPPCSPLQRTCNYFLTTCPQLLEVIQETRHDPQDVFMGGRNFEYNPEFTFSPGEFECGDLLLLQFSDTEAKAQMM